MCTALSINGTHHYFGRTLDLDISYGEQVCVMPRNFPFSFRLAGADGGVFEMTEHYALIGMAFVAGGTPLFFEAANEKGLCMAGLNFPGNAYYFPQKEDCDNVTPFEFIPWILGQCAAVEEAREKLARINLVDIPFSPQLPLSPLHWILSDRKESIVVESMRDGLKIHENPLGVMTNNPPFEYQLFNRNNYRGVGRDTGANRFPGKEELQVYCQGLGGLGLPGDVSSMSRFVRAAFHAGGTAAEWALKAENRESTDLEGNASKGVGMCAEGKRTEKEICAAGKRTGKEICAAEESIGKNKEVLNEINQFFHLMNTVEMPMNSCWTDAGTWDYTVYTSCIDADLGVYYYTTYGNHRISCVDMYRETLDGSELLVYNVIHEEQIFCHQSASKR